MYPWKVSSSVGNVFFCRKVHRSDAECASLCQIHSSAGEQAPSIRHIILGSRSLHNVVVCSLATQTPTSLSHVDGARVAFVHQEWSAEDVRPLAGAALHALFLDPEASSKNEYCRQRHCRHLFGAPVILSWTPTVLEGHKHRVTTPEKPRKIPRSPPQNPAEPCRTLGENLQNFRRDPAEPSERLPQSPLRGKFPRRASRRVVPLRW